MKLPQRLAPLVSGSSSLLMGVGMIAAFWDAESLARVSDALLRNGEDAMTLGDPLRALFVGCGVLSIIAGLIALGWMLFRPVYQSLAYRHRLRQERRYVARLSDNVKLAHEGYLVRVATFAELVGRPPRMIAQMLDPAFLVHDYEGRVRALDALAGAITSAAAKPRD